MSDQPAEAENIMDEKVQPQTLPDNVLFLAGRFWGRDEVARSGFLGVILKSFSYAYVSFSFLLILYGYQNSRPFTTVTAILAFGGLLWAANVYTSRNMRRDKDRETLLKYGINVERTEKSVNLLSWGRIKLGWEAPPAIMTLSRGTTPFLSIEQGLADTDPTVNVLDNSAFALVENEQGSALLASTDVIQPVKLGRLAPGCADGIVTDGL